MIPTALKFFEDNLLKVNGVTREDLDLAIKQDNDVHQAAIQSHIEFAKLHVTEALKEISNKLPDSLEKLQSYYPLTNIK